MYCAKLAHPNKMNINTRRLNKWWVKLSKKVAGISGIKSCSRPVVHKINTTTTAWKQLNVRISMLRSIISKTKAMNNKLPAMAMDALFRLDPVDTAFDNSLSGNTSARTEKTPR